MREVAHIEKNAKDIIVITNTLENDLYENGQIFESVKENLAEGKSYIYVVPDNKLISEALKKYSTLHSFVEKQIKIIKIPADDFMFYSEIVVYNLLSGEDQRTSVLEYFPTETANLYVRLDGFHMQKITKMAMNIIKKHKGYYL